MGPSIFYSCQTDAPDKCNRRFIRDALDAAVAELGRGAQVIDAPRIESGMEGTPGRRNCMIELQHSWMPEIWLVVRQEDGGRIGFSSSFSLAGSKELSSNERHGTMVGVRGLRSGA